MKKVLAFILVLCFCFGFAACGSQEPAPNNNNETGPASTTNTVEVSLTSGIREEQTTYNCSFDYDDAYFDGDAKVFNKNLALLSFGASISTQSKSNTVKFLEDIGFENIQASNVVNLPIEAQIVFTLACKEIDGIKTIAVVIRGLGYDVEWASNFALGASGNHYGFEQSANVVYSALKNYITTNNYGGTVKLWITGYSRAGAVANVLAYKLLSGNEISIAQTNMFVYTFEAPACLDAESVQSYENVFNITNKNDIVARIIPEKYGLARCGVDIDIYNVDIEAKVRVFDNQIVLPEFTLEEESEENRNFTNPSEFIDYIVSMLTKEQAEDYVSVDMSTRANFVTNVQPTICYIANLYFGLKQTTRDSIMAAFEAMKDNMWSMLGLLAEDGIYNFIKPYIDADGIEYNDTELRAQCAVVNKIIEANLSVVLAAFSYQGNFSYVVDMHYPEITYVLLLAYSPAA